MTDTRQTGTARDQAIQIVHRTVGEIEGHMLPDTPGALLDAIPTDLLQRLHDERLMTRPAPRSIP